MSNLFEVLKFQMLGNFFMASNFLQLQIRLPKPFHSIHGGAEGREQFDTMHFFPSIVTLIALLVASAYGHNVSVESKKGKGGIWGGRPNPAPTPLYMLGPLLLDVL